MGQKAAAVDPITSRINGTVGGAPVAVSGFTMQWGVILLASIIGATSSMAFRLRVKWIFALALVAFFLHSATMAALALGLEMGLPRLNRLAMGAFVVAWGVGPIVLAGV